MANPTQIALRTGGTLFDVARQNLRPLRLGFIGVGLRQLSGCKIRGGYEEQHAPAKHSQGSSKVCWWSTYRGPPSLFATYKCVRSGPGSLVATFWVSGQKH